MKFEIIFVRHGQSCANQRKHAIPASHIFYPDPELTEFGKKRSIDLGGKLLEEIEKKWKGKEWTVGASSMIRAQQTAFYMLKKPFIVMPFISETGKTYDNIPISDKAVQVKKMESFSPGISSFILENESTLQTNSNKADFQEFKNWAKGPGITYFGHTPVELGGDGIYRAVLFTHSSYLKHIFPQFPPMRNKSIRNNEAIFFRWDSDKTYQRGSNNKNITDAEHFTFGLGDSDVLYTCPDNCQRWTPCNLGYKLNNSVKQQRYTNNIAKLYTKKNIGGSRRNKTYRKGGTP